MALCLLSCPVASVFAQADSTALAREEAQRWADVRKPYFRVTKDDSLFVVNNSSQPFRYEYYTRPELAGFMEGMFFSANPGEVIGPLFIDDYAMLFKIIAFDSTYRMRASHIYVKPEGNSRKDTLAAVKKADKYLTQLKKGASFADLAAKYSNDGTAQTGGDLGWFLEGAMVKELEEAVMKARKGDLFVLKTPLGAHVVRITEDKVKEPRGRVKVVPLMKKI